MKRTWSQSQYTIIRLYNYIVVYTENKGEVVNKRLVPSKSWEEVTKTLPTNIILCLLVTFIFSFIIIIYFLTGNTRFSVTIYQSWTETRSFYDFIIPVLCIRYMFFITFLYLPRFNQRSGSDISSVSPHCLLFPLWLPYTFSIYDHIRGLLEDPRRLGQSCQRWSVYTDKCKIY